MVVVVLVLVVEVVVDVDVVVVDVVVVVVVVVGLITFSDENSVKTSISELIAFKYPRDISSLRKVDVLEMINSPIFSFLEDDCRPRKLKNTSMLTCTVESETV